ATEYFEVIEKSASTLRRNFLERAQRLVADLYRLALSAPGVRPDTAASPTVREGVVIELHPPSRSG
ncbi:MAG TPA: hypothetical protein VKS99_03530, partial [Blastocatellia bacterium]|nr:hypothetical protein [Blastocatellia bacterium]